MAWTGGSTQTTGTIITATIWNQHLGGGGDLDFITDGVKILNSLVHASSLLTPSSSPNQGKFLMAASALSGGLDWAHPHMIHSLVGGAF